VDAVLVHLGVDAELLEDVEDHAQLVRPRALDGDVGVRDGGEADEAPDLQVVGADRVGRPVELLGARDAQRVGPDAADLGAHRHQHPAEPLHVRLAGGVHEDGLPVRQRRGHDHVLGGRHRGLVEEDLRARQPPVGPQVVDLADLEAGAEGLEPQEVGVEAAAADDVAARRGQLDLAEAREDGPGEEDRRADAAGERGVDRRPGEVLGGDADGLGGQALDLAAEGLEDLEHDLDVRDVGQVLEDDRLGREQARRQDRQGFVLAASWRDGALERSASLDDETLHDSLPVQRWADHTAPGSGRRRNRPLTCAGLAFTQGSAASGAPAVVSPRSSEPMLHCSAPVPRRAPPWSARRPGNGWRERPIRPR